MAERRMGLLPIKGCDNSNRSGDVIFVHGLGDHPITTWYPNPQEIKKEVDTDEFWTEKLPNLNFWPNWLGEYRSDLGIWSYGYEAMPFLEDTPLAKVPAIGQQIPTGKASPILDQASELLELLQQRDILQRPRIFITHSLGGLIVKETLDSAYDDFNSNPKMKQIIGQTKGVVFLATPHQGSDLANFQEILARTVKAFRLLKENVILNELRSDNINTQLYKMRKWYSGNAQVLAIETKAFYETEETEIPAIGKRIVVDRDSSDPNVGSRPTAVNGADHFTIAKPQNQSSVVYIGVKELIDEYLPIQKNQNLKYLQVQPTAIEKQEEDEGGQQEKQELAKIPSPSYIELLGREQEIEVIKNVLEDPTSKRLVAITGLGGNGKTSLAIEAAKSFKQMGFQNIVWYTVPAKRNDTCITFHTILEEIANQLGTLEVPIIKAEELKRKTREVLSNTRVLIVLDNMDTSEEPQNEIAEKLCSILGKSKVLFTSRHRFQTLGVDVFERYLQGLDAEQSIKLMEQTAQERNISNLDSNSAESLLKLTGKRKTGYLPLALKLVTGQLQNKSPLEIARSLESVTVNTTDLEPDNKNIFHKFWWHIYFPSFKILSKSELDLMLFMAGLTEQEGTTQDTLLYMTREKLTEKQFTQAINRTWCFCLVEKERYGKQRYYLHMLTSKFFKTILAYAGRINQ